MQVIGGSVWYGWALSILFFAIIKDGKSQSILPGYRMRAITVNNGLPQGWVREITQDQKGVIWMVSSGLVRYDGRKFFTYQHKNNDPATLLGNDILSIQPDSAGNLWITYNFPGNGTNTGPLDVFNTATGSVRHISAEAGFSWMNAISGNRFIVQKGSNYFLGNNRNLIRFNFQTGEHQPINLPPGEFFTSIGEDHLHQVWITTTKRIYKLSGSVLLPVAAIPGASSTQVADSGLLMKQPTRAADLFEDVAGNIVSLGQKCIIIYQPATGNTRQLALPVSKQQPVGLVKAANGHFYFLLDGNIWSLGSNASESIPTRLITGENFVDPLLADKSGTVWAIKEDATGLRLYNFQPANFRSYAYKNGFSHDVLEPWLHNPISWLDLGSYNTRYTKDMAGNSWVVNYIMYRQNGKLTEQSNLYRLTATGAVPFQWSGSNPLQITFDNHNQLWILHSDTSSNFYLDRVNPHNGTTEHFAYYPANTDNSSNGYISYTNNCITVIDGHQLRVYNTTTKACTIYTGTQLGLESTMLMMVPDPNDDRQLWITSQGSGISKLNLSTGKVLHLTEADGLLNNTVYMMVPDKKGFFWCSSNKGLFRFNPVDHSTVSFSVEDGLPGNEFNRFHFIETPNGHFIFGGTEGYTIFHPDSVYIDTYQPLAVISNLLVNNQPLSSVLPLLKDSITGNLQKLELQYNHNFISFSFSALQFSNPLKIRYRYQLKGIDKDWVIAGPEATASYTFLPPGTYVFKVNASNTDGIWSKKITTLEITILAPWWKTTWAYLLYFLVAGAILFSLYKTWLRRVQNRQKLVLQQKEAEQIWALDEMKSRFFSNITHEFRTPLTLITAPLEEMQRNGIPAELMPKLRGVQRNANQLLHLINQLLDMAKLEANRMLVDMRRGDLGNFLREICDSFLPPATTKNIRITFTNHLLNQEYLFDGDKLQKILTNLLSNALKFTPNGGNIMIQAEPVTNSKVAFFQLTVTDTGIGIPKEKLPYIFNRFYQVDDSCTKENEGTGIGLALVKELTDLLGGTISAVNNPVDSGTCFTVQLPLLLPTGNEAQAYSLPIANTYLPEDAISPVNQAEATDKPLLLVTEDNPELNAFIASNFQKEYRVITAANGKIGLELAQQKLPDIIISDARMPEMDGFSFCEAVKKNPETSHIAFVLLTAKATQQSRIEGLQSHADDYITKPFHVEELQLRIRNILQRQQQLRLYYNRQLTAPEETLVTVEQEDPFMQKLYAYLEKHLEDTELTVENLAVAARVSQRTLTRKLNAIAGVSGVELIKQYRLKKAAEFLLHGSTVAETAFATGYDNPNYFSTAFKAFYNLSPTEFTKQAKAAK